MWVFFKSRNKERCGSKPRFGDINHSVCVKTNIFVQFSRKHCYVSDRFTFNLIDIKGNNKNLKLMNL